MKGQYLQIYTKSLSSSCMIEESGNGSVIPLDGRLSLGSCCAAGVKFCRLNAKIGFRVMAKKSANGMPLWGHILTDMYVVTSNTVTN
jgi:hypothetical protein